MSIGHDGDRDVVDSEFSVEEWVHGLVETNVILQAALFAVLDRAGISDINRATDLLARRAGMTPHPAAKAIYEGIAQHLAEVWPSSPRDSDVH